MLSGLAILGKTVFFWVFAVSWTGFMGYVVALPFALVERLLGLVNSQIGQTVLYRGIRLTSLFWRAAADVRVDAEERVGEGEAVVVCNHHSFIDIYLLLHLYPRIHLTAKRSLFRIPFLGWAMKVFQQIPHSAEDPEGALLEAEHWLRRGRTVGVIPEGTRHPDGEIGRFHSGAFRLAQRTTQRVQPVVVVGTGRVWRKGQFWIRRLGPVRMKVLPAATVPANLGRTELLALIEEIRATMLVEHRRLEREIEGR